uniref:trichohyalin-like isoform X2 n=1 Tax=Oncorhynchus gorbuscha TaxID=8017 RepID=UPI001EAF7DCC|nr:trichohyalin-like isoform X2 [Oncorhynchus gorbuscha]
MGTKRPSLTPFDTSDPSNQSASYQNPQPISQICRETSPRPGTVARTDRERERIREEEWRREREMERLKDKTRNRRKEMESGPRERNREKDCSPISRGREEEREWRERERGGAGERRANGRPTSNLEIRNHRDREKERRKGDTFPRMVKHSEERDRRMSAFVEEDVGKEGMRQLERPKGTEMDDWERERETAAKIQRYRDAERDFQSHREREREKERIRAQEDREKNGGKPMEDKTVRRRERAREAEPDFRERRRERDSKGDDLWSKRERYMDGERERSKLRQGEREDGRREGDSQNYSDREGRGGRKEGNTEGQRDTRSEGDSDGEKRNERVRDDNRRELKHLHSKSEGDTEGNAAWDRVREKEKERQKWRGGEIYRERDGRRDAYRQRVREGDRDGRRDAYRQRVREGDRDGRRDAYRQRVRERDRDGKSDMERYRERDRRKVREVERERDEVREGGRREDRPRERRDLEKVRVGTQPNVTGERGKRMDGERFRERERYSKGEDEERRCREKRDRETDPKREGGADGASRSLSETDPKREGEADGASRSLSETAPRVPPRVQSSGEWSSDIERERQWRRGRESHEEKESEGDVDRGQRECSERERPDRVRGREEGKEETIPKRPEQRKMWLLPQKVRYNKDSSLEDDVIERERDRHTNRWRERSEEEDRSVEQRTVRDKERKTEGEGQEDRSVEQRKSIGEEREAEREGGRERYLERGLNVDEDDETEDWRSYSRGEEHQTYSDGEREERWQRDRETERENVTDKTEGDREEEGGSDRYTLFESDGGSDREWEGGRDRIPSSEDGFITVSSGGEEEFEDCKEFLEVGVAIHVTRQPVSFQGSEGETKRGGGRRHERERERAEERTEQKDDALEGEVNDGKGKKQPTYVFCVIGQTLPRSKPNQTAVLGDMESERTNQNPGYGHRDSDDITHLLHENPSRDGDQGAEDERKIVRDEIHVPKEERTDTEESSIVDVSHTTLERESGERLKVMEENPYAEIERRRNSETEKLLKEWRERHEEYTETRERDPTDRRRTEPEIGPSSHPSGEYHHHGIPVVDQATSDQNNPVVMSPEEAVDIQICIRGAWSTEEEAKRHSQASHMKWAKNVLSEILGSSEEPALGNPQPESQGGQVVSQTTRGTERVEEELEEEKDETLEGGGASPVYATVQKRKKRGRKSVEERLAELEAEPGKLEDERDEEEEEVSFNWGDMDLRNVTDTIRMARRNSKFYNSQLYQQYSETAQNREILSQSCSDALSIYEELPVPLSPVPSSLAPSLPPARRPLPCLPPVIHPHSLSHSGSTSSGTSAKFLSVPQPPQPPPARPSSPRLSISLTQSPSLWQEIPEVRNSAAFGELTNDQRRLQEVQFEVVTSEASYCRSLDIVVDHFVKSKQLGELLTTQDRSWLFSRLADVRAISHSFLSKLEERVESDMMHFTVCDIIARHCQRFKKVYVPYLTNQSYQDATYQRLMDENQGFRRVVEKLERSPVCQRLPLRSFLILPFQRITRIKLLVQNIVKRTAQGTEEEVQAIKAMKLLERLIQESNDSITQMKSIESLVSLSARVDFECRTLPLVSQSRRLVREGPVTEMMDFSLKETERSVYLHLFNDYLLLSLNKEGGRFTVIDHAPVSELRAENCRVKLHSLEKNLFRLHLNKKALLLSTDTQGDKLRWISAVSRPHPVIDYSAEQDFTQMQCVRAFVAHQPDELSLEKAEVIFVHQQSSDGWVEGTRLSDRHRGWTPESHLETIASLRVRQRNLQDALKITTATAAV